MMLILPLLNDYLLHPAVLRAAVVVEHRAEPVVPAEDHVPPGLPERAGRAGGGDDLEGHFLM